MRAFLITIIFTSSLKAFGQQETFLMYAGQLGGWLAENKNDSTFHLKEFVVLDAKKLTIRSIPFPGHPEFITTKKRTARYTRASDQITFFDEGELKVAKILKSPIFNGGNKAGYFLVPIKNAGLRVTPFEGQLIDYHEWGKMKFILDTIRGERPQMVYLINFAQPSRAEAWHPMIYLDEKYFNLVSLPGVLGWFQLNKITADSIWQVNIYSLYANNRDSTAWHGIFTKKDLLSKPSLKRIIENLQGKWSQTSGLKLNSKLAPDSSKTLHVLDSLKDCKYTFNFDKDKLILERSFLNPEMKAIDTLSYTINSSGDWIKTRGNEKYVNIILDKMDSKNAQFSIHDDWDLGGERRGGYLVLYLKKE